MKIISFDLSSGDRGSIVASKAAIDFSILNPDWKIIAFSIDKIENLPSNIELRICSELITQEDGVMEVRRKKNSTLIKSIESVLNGEASAILSAAASGPLVAASFLMSKSINSSIKPAFAPLISSKDGDLRVMLDVGANIGADSKMIENYAIMGTQFIKSMGISKNPIVKQLNIGSEDKKGTDLQKEAFQLMKKNSSINFKGNIEANEILIQKELHVIVTEAYSGNIALKALEGATDIFVEMIKESTKESFFSKIGFLLASNFRKKLKIAMNEEFLGGAIVLGLNHLVIKSHGRSNEKMFINSLNTTKKLIEKNMIKNIKEVFKNE